MKQQPLLGKKRNNSYLLYRKRLLHYLRNYSTNAKKRISLEKNSKALITYYFKNNSPRKFKN